ncbi:MAG: Por secretion system protein [Prevotella sp.]|nr:Por secretion system protein [Prevotella sp.]
MRITKTILCKWLCVCLLVLPSLTAGAQQLAFPGAQGYGRYTTGGKAIDARGTKTYHVTSLDDCTDSNLKEGTLRWALHTGDDTPRTIVFDVCGTIYLKSVLAMAHPNVSILGQTAPGKGICIAGYTLKISKSNVILRYLRFRAGDIPNKSMTSLDVENVKHIIIDHCSMTWSMEENLTMYDCDSTTVQYCILAEGLYLSKNAKGARAYATQWGGEHATMHHCLIANVNNRAPRFNGMRKHSKYRGEHDQYVDNEFINNVVFNWGKPNSVYGGENYQSANQGNSYNRVIMEGNYFKPGPNTQLHCTEARYFVGASCHGNNDSGLGEWYLNGNMFELHSKWAPKTAVWSDASLKRVNADNLYGFADSLAERAFNTELGANKDIYNRYVLKQRPAYSGMPIETAKQAYRHVIKEAGCRLPELDEVDARILHEAAGKQDPRFAGRDSRGNVSRAMGIINSQYDVKLTKEDPNLHGWPYLGK